MAEKSIKKEHRLRLPRLVEPLKAKRNSSIAVNISTGEHLTSNLVNNKYENWLYPGLSQTRFDGFDSCCQSSGGQSSSSSSSTMKGLCRRIPNIKELNTLLFAPDNKSILKWKKLLPVGIGKEQRIENVQDELIQSQVLCIMGKADGSVSIRIPKNLSTSLGITLPYLNMIVRNLDCYFSFEIQILDNMGIKRLFKMSNFQSLVRVKPESCSIPMRLDVGWNQVIIDLPGFVKDAFGTRYRETIHVQINANIYVRRIYFSSEVFDEITLPAEYKIFPLGDIDKTPHYRKRNNMDDIEFGLKDIVLPKKQSTSELINTLFETTSGYIEIDEENWDQPKLIIKPNEDLEYELQKNNRSPKSIDSPNSYDSLKVFTSTEGQDRINIFLQEINKPSKIIPTIMSSNFFDEIQNEPIQQQQQQHSTTLNVANLLDDLSEIYDFLAVISTDIIPQASNDTLEDLTFISESLKDMASFSGIWQNQIIISPKENDHGNETLAPPPITKIKKKLNIMNNGQLPKPITEEEIILTVSGEEPNDGIPVHVNPCYNDSEPSSMQILNIKLDKEIIDYKLSIANNNNNTMENLQSEFENINQTHQDVNDQNLSTKQILTKNNESNNNNNCIDFTMKSYTASVTSLKNFASLSSTLLDELSTVTKFIENFIPSTNFFIKSQNSSSSNEVMNHLKKMSISLKQIASVTSIEAVQNLFEEKEKLIFIDEIPITTYNVFKNYNNNGLEPPEYKGSIEMFNSYSSDCCMVTNNPPFLVQHSDILLVDNNQTDKQSGMSLFDSDSNLNYDHTHTENPLLLESNKPNPFGITTEFIKLVKKLSSDMIKHFSTESLRVLSESKSPESTPINLDSDSHKLLAGFNSENELIKCSTLHHRKQKLQSQQHTDIDIEDELSSLSLKYQPSNSTIQLGPVTNFSADEISHYEISMNISKDGNSLEKIEPYLNYDAIPCESWKQFFFPNNVGGDCNENICTMSEVWNEFGKVTDTFPIGFSMTSTKKSSPLISGVGRHRTTHITPFVPESKCSSISEQTIYSNTSSETICGSGSMKNKSLHQLSKTFEDQFLGSKLPEIITRSTKENRKEISVPASKSVSSSSSLPQSVVVSANSSLGLISMTNMKNTNQFRKYDSKVKNKNQGLKYTNNKKITKETIEKNNNMKRKTISKTSSLLTLDSISDSDCSKKYPSLKILKKMCLDSLKKSPGDVLNDISIFQSDHGFWSPVIQSSESDIGSGESQKHEDCSSSTDSLDEYSDKITKTTFDVFPDNQNVLTSDEDECLTSSQSVSYESLVMVSPPCSVASTSDEFLSPHLSHEQLTDGQVLVNPSHTTSHHHHRFYWNLQNEKTPSISSSSKSSLFSEDDKLNPKENGTGDFTTILAPELSQASLFQEKKDRKLTYSKYSVNALTASTHLLLQGQATNTIVQPQPVKNGNVVPNQNKLSKLTPNK